MQDVVKHCFYYNMILKLDGVRDLVFAFRTGWKCRHKKCSRNEIPAQSNVTSPSHNVITPSVNWHTLSGNFFSCFLPYPVKKKRETPNPGHQTIYPKKCRMGNRALARTQWVLPIFWKIVPVEKTSRQIAKALWVTKIPGGGGTRMARGDIRLVHWLTKSTLITYFSGIKKYPKYAFLHAFFIICLSRSFQNLSIWPKTHPFFQFCIFAPLNDVRAYSAWSWKQP